MKKLTKSEIIGLIMLLVCTTIWGFAFVVQKKISENGMHSFYLNAIRFLMAGIVLLPISLIIIKKKKIEVSVKLTLIGGLLTGLFLGIASNFQQFGIERTTSGKAGFLTAMYIVFVPLFSFIVFKKHITIKQIIGIIVAVVGVGLMSLQNDFTVNLGDVLCLICAIFFAVQIMMVDHFVKKINTFLLSATSFLTAGLVSLIMALIFADISFEIINKSILEILFMGLCSSLVAYTLQFLGQKRVDDTPASLVMSLESVFALIFSMIIFSERLLVKEWIGCILLLIGVVMVQIFAKNEIIMNNEMPSEN